MRVFARWIKVVLVGAVGVAAVVVPSSTAQAADREWHIGDIVDRYLGFEDEGGGDYRAWARISSDDVKYMVNVTHLHVMRQVNGRWEKVPRAGAGGAIGNWTFGEVTIRGSRAINPARCNLHYVKARFHWWPDGGEKTHSWWRSPKVRLCN